MGKTKDQIEATEATEATEAETSIENAPDAETVEGGADANADDLDGQNPPEDEGATGADDEAEDDWQTENAARLAAIEVSLCRIGAATANGSVPDNLRAALEAEDTFVTITDTVNGAVTVKLHGVTATSTFGLHRALLDWCMAASRVIMSGKAPE